MDVPHLPDRKAGKRFCDPGEDSPVHAFFYDSFFPSGFLGHHSFLFFDIFAFPIKMFPAVQIPEISFYRMEFVNREAQETRERLKMNL